MDIMKMGQNPNYLGSWDLDDSPNRTLTLTIRKIVDEKVVSDGRSEECTVCHWAEDYKPMILNVTNKKRIVKLYHTKQTDELVGKRLMITSEKVKAFGDVFDALRVVPQVPAAPAAAAKCEQCGNDIAPAGKMTSAQVAEYCRKKYGKALCSSCATALAEQKKEAEQNAKADS